MFRRRFTAMPEPDLPLCVIGDIHGRSDLLIRLLAQIDAGAGGSDRVIVTVGDHFDRGPDSAGVLEILMRLHADPDRKLVSLMGNHEAMLLDFLADPAGERRWLRIGGMETLESFGLTPPTSEAPEASLIEAAEALRAALGPDRLAFIEELDLSYHSGNVFICHAGADPALPLSDQPRQTLLWNRDYSGIRRDGNWVVHGHTIQSRPAIEQGRINIDTGAVFTDRLTAALIWKTEIAFIDTLSPVA